MNYNLIKLKNCQALGQAFSQRSYCSNIKFKRFSNEKNDEPQRKVAWLLVVRLLMLDFFGFQNFGG
jgi:hypothetical protein